MSTRPCSLLRGVALVLVTALAASCVAYKHVPVTVPTASGTTATDLSRRVKEGDVVRVELAGGRRMRFTVASVDASTLVGAGGERVASSDIVRLEREAIDRRVTAALNLPVGLFLWALWVAAHV